MARVFGRREDTQAGGGDRLGMVGSGELSVRSIRCVDVHSSGVDTGKAQLRLAQTESIRQKQHHMHIPYIFLASLYIYNKFYQEPGRSDLAFSDAFIYQEAINSKIGESYTGDLHLADNTLQLRSASDLFWFKTGQFLEAGITAWC